MAVFGTDSEKPFDFRGNGREWFGIWIVNLLLSIVTIGIYSAWAKVRRMKYFYNNTYVDDRNFDYHATGKQILIGRLIVIAAYILFAVLSALSPALSIILALAFLIAFPWLLVRAMKFNARMSSFSNVRFDFDGAYGRAAFLFILLPLMLYIGVVAAIGSLIWLFSDNLSGGLIFLLIVLALIIITAAYAIFDRAQKRFSTTHHSLGTSRFSLDITLKPFMIAQFAAAAWIAFFFGLLSLVLGFEFISMLDNLNQLDEGGDVAGQATLFGVFYGVLFLGVFPAAVIYQALIRNAVYNSAELEGGHRFRSNVNPARLFWIAASNAVIVLCTLFLLLPWAQIRMARYLAQHTHVIPQGSLDDFVGTQQEAGGAAGDAFSDFEGIDVGLPV